VGIDPDTTHRNTDHRDALYQPVDEATLIEIVSFVWPILFGDEIEPGPASPIEH